MIRINFLLVNEIHWNLNIMLILGPIGNQCYKKISVKIRVLKIESIKGAIPLILCYKQPC